MSVRATKVKMPVGTYGATRVRASAADVTAAAPAPRTGATNQDGKYIP